MKTVILCGGTGYRLKEETEFRPKPMVQIGGKPILWHIMKIYEHFGYRDFIIALGYKGDDIKDYFLNQRFFQYDFTLWTDTRKTLIYKDRRRDMTHDSFQLTFVDTGLESLTGERVRRIQPYLNNRRFMLTYGDGVSDLNIKELVSFHRKEHVVGTITGVHPHSRWGLIRRNKEHRITTFRQKPVLNEFVNGGFMIFEPELFDYIKPDEMIESALERLAKKRLLAMYPYEGFWHAMDHYQDVADLNTLWHQGAPWKVWH